MNPTQWRMLTKEEQMERSKRMIEASLYGQDEHDAITKELDADLKEIKREYDRATKIPAIKRRNASRELKARRQELMDLLSEVRTQIALIDLEFQDETRADWIRKNDEEQRVREEWYTNKYQPIVVPLQEKRNELVRSINQEYIDIAESRMRGADNGSYIHS